MMFYRILTRETMPESDVDPSPENVFSLPALPPEETGGVSEKESYTNVTTNRANTNGMAHEDSNSVSSAQQDSTTNISFTTIFEDSLQNSSIRSDSFSKSDTRSQSFEIYEENYSCNSSDSRFPAWSFSIKSTDS